MVSISYVGHTWNRLGVEKFKMTVHRIDTVVIFTHYKNNLGRILNNITSTATSSKIDVNHGKNDRSRLIDWLTTRPILGGPAQVFPPKRFFLGGRPLFPKRKKHSKNRQTPNKERPFFRPRWELPPPIVAILRLISSGPGQSIVELAIVRACRIAFDMPWRSPFCCFFCSHCARAQ